jgi:hypothetical protein
MHFRSIHTAAFWIREIPLVYGVLRRIQSKVSDFAVLALALSACIPTDASETTPWAMPAPFLDLLPALQFSSTSIRQDHSLQFDSHGAGIAEVPARINDQDVSIDLRQKPYFSFIYSSCLQHTIDLDLRHRGAETNDYSLAQNVPSIGKVRLTLPKTGGYPALWTVDLRSLLIPDLESYVVSRISLSRPVPNPPCLEILALGFTESRPSQESRVGIAKAGSVNHLFFYNGYLQQSDDLNSAWSTIPSARNNFTTDRPANTFFKTVKFDLPTVPEVYNSRTFSGKGAGYVNLSVQSGFQMIANQLRSGEDTVSALMEPPDVSGVLPDGAALIKLGEPNPFVPASGSNILRHFTQVFGPIDLTGASVNVFENGTWTDPNQTLAPGEGAIFYNPSQSFTLTFVGGVLQGTLMNYVPAGLSIRSAMIPQAGPLTSTLGYQPSPGDTVWRINTGALKQYVYTDENTWTPSEPQFSTSESFLINAKKSSVWTRYFDLSAGANE